MLHGMWEEWWLTALPLWSFSMALSLDKDPCPCIPGQRGQIWDFTHLKRLREIYRRHAFKILRWEASNLLVSGHVGSCVVFRGEGNKEQCIPSRWLDAPCKSQYIAALPDDQQNWLFGLIGKSPRDFPLPLRACWVGTFCCRNDSFFERKVLI